MFQAIHWVLPLFEGSLEAIFGECFKHFIGFCLSLRVAWRLFLANVSSNSLGFCLF